jgi:RNA polymerase sigma-70 factor, ECF subfamily
MRWIRRTPQPLVRDEVLFRPPVSKNGKLRHKRQTMLDDRDLLSRLRALDADALTSVYDAFHEALFRYAYRLLGDEALAEDCTTETFSRLLKALSAGNGPKQFLKAYLYRTAHNWITDQLRSGALGALSLDGMVDDDEAAELVSDAPSPAQAFEQRYAAQHVRRALALLTDEQRLVIVMKFFEELSNEEIAAAINKPVGAVKSLQHRGLGALRRALTHVMEVEA